MTRTTRLDRSSRQQDLQDLKQQLDWQAEESKRLVDSVGLECKSGLYRAAFLRLWLLFEEFLHHTLQPAFETRTQGHLRAFGCNLVEGVHGPDFANTNCVCGCGRLDGKQALSERTATRKRYCGVG